jgi:hypothetical protein
MRIDQVEVMMLHEEAAERFGNALKSPKCVACGTEYHYIMQVKATGYGASVAVIGVSHATGKAARDADRALQKQLNGCEPVPCPKCGTYQPKMIEAIRRDHLAAWKKAGIAVFAVGLLVFVVVGIKEGRFGTGAFLGVLMAIFGAAVWIYKEIASKNFNPNAAPVEERIELGRKLSIDPNRLAQAQANADKESAARAATSDKGLKQIDGVITVVVGFAAVLGGLWLTAMGWKAVQSAKSSANWPNVPGIAIITPNEQRGTTYYDLGYSYVVDGVEFKGNYLAFGVRGVKKGDEYQNGQAVTVWYEPTNPTNSAITKGMHESTGLEFFGFGIPLILGGVVAIGYGWYRFRSPGKPDNFRPSARLH